MQSLKEALRCAINGKDEFCQLCLGTDSEVMSMRDEIVVHDHGNPQEIIDILRAVLGTEITVHYSPSDKVCKQCLKDALGNYRFVTMCRNNTKALANAIELISPRIRKQEGFDRCQSLFISINPILQSITSHYDYKKCPNKKRDILKHVKKLVQPRGKSMKNVTGTWNNFNNDFKNNSNRVYSKMISENDNYKVLRTEDDRLAYQCKHCQRIGFHTVYNITRHVNMHLKAQNLDVEIYKKAQEETIICSTCGVTLKGRYSIKRHEQSHAKPKQCPKCKRFYKNTYTLTHHLCYVGERPKPVPCFVCELCGKKYGRERSLFIHMKFDHGDGKPEVCQWCNKKFYSRSALKGHIVKHTKVKAFECNICNGRFVTKPSLRYHIRTHTGEKPYKCKFCDKRFLSSSRRSDHVRLHHLPPSIPCPICGRMFKTHSGKNLHKLLHSNPESSLYIGKVAKKNKKK